MATETILERVKSWPVATKSYIEELRQEMRRVTWPTWPQVRATTIVVIVCVFVFAAYFAVVDLILGRAITKLFTVLSK